MVNPNFNLSKSIDRFESNREIKQCLCIKNSLLDFLIELFSLSKNYGFL